MFLPADSIRAEMFGLPGAGKSWLCAALCERLAGDFLSSVDAAERATEHAVALARLQADERVASFQRAALRMLDEGDEDMRLRRRRKNWLNRDLKTALLVEATPQPVLCDPSLLQRGASVASSYSDGAKVAEQYFLTVPPPRVAILVDTPKTLVAERIGTRGAHQSHHMAIYDRNAAAVDIGARILKERNVSVILADGARLAAQDEAELARIASELRSSFAMEARIK